MYRMTWPQMRGAFRLHIKYGESCIFCFNRIRIGMHASNTKRDSIQTLLFVLVSQPARLVWHTHYKLFWARTCKIVLIGVLLS